MRKALLLSWLFGLVMMGAGCSTSADSWDRPALFIDELHYSLSGWKLVDEPKWGFRFGVPKSFIDKDYEDGQGWVHASDTMKVVVKFGRNPSEETLKQKLNYRGKVERFNGLAALFCTYDKSEGSGVTRVTALYFLEKREQMSGPNEPSFQVEYQSEAEEKAALQILHTVRFYNH